MVRSRKGNCCATMLGLPWLLTVLKDRPLVMKRFPNGITGKAFYQQRAPDEIQTGVRRVTLPEDDEAYASRCCACPRHIESPPFWRSALPSLRHRRVDTRPCRTPRSSAPKWLRLLRGAVHPPTTNSWRRTNLILRQSVLRLPTAYRESAFLAISPSQPSSWAR